MRHCEVNLLLLKIPPLHGDSKEGSGSEKVLAAAWNAGMFDKPEVLAPALPRRPGFTNSSSDNQGAFVITLPVGCRPDEEAGNVFSTKSAVTPGANAVCLYYPPTTPPPDGIDMHVEQLSHLTCRQHRAQVFMICHNPFSPLFNHPISTIPHLTLPHNPPNG